MGSDLDDHAYLPKRYCRLFAIPNNDMVDIFASSDDTERDILGMLRYCLRVVVRITSLSFDNIGGRKGLSNVLVIFVPDL